MPGHRMHLRLTPRCSTTPKALMTVLGLIAGVSICISLVFCVIGARSILHFTARLDGFTVVNTQLGYPMAYPGKRGEVFVAVENLTDERYRYRSESSYQMPGRWAQVGLVASFN